VEITTGPLGQGLGAAVGMAMAARRERGLLDSEAAPGQSPFDHHVYVIASDGDMMEAISSEASSLAGHQELGSLIVFYDQNHISIEDDTGISFSEDVAARYAAYGWHVRTVDWRGKDGYGEDIDAVRRPSRHLRPGLRRHRRPSRLAPARQPAATALARYPDRDPFRKACT
jgi:transketolase